MCNYNITFQIYTHLNIILRQQERLWVSCFNKLGLAFPMKPLFHNIVLCSLSALKFLANL